MNKLETRLKYRAMSTSNLLLCAVVMFTQSNAFCQETRPIKENERIVQLFQGVWTGPCYNLKPSNTQNKTQFAVATRTVQFDPQAQNLKWTTSYGEGQSKNYTLVGVNSGDGHYAVDEGQGVLIGSYLTEQSLTSLFSVQGTLLHSVERVQGDELIFDLTVFPDKPLNSNSGVNTFPLKTLQRCVFKKQ